MRHFYFERLVAGLLTRNRALIRTVDIILFCLAGYLAYLMVGDSYADVRLYSFFVLLVSFGTGYIFSALSIYEDRRYNRFKDEVVSFSFAWLLVILIVGITLFALKIGLEFSRLWVAVTFLLAYVFLVNARLIGRKLNQHSYLKGNKKKSILVVGAGELGKTVVKRMLDQPWFGVTPRAVFDPKPEEYSNSIYGVPVEGGLENIAKYIEAHRSGEIGDGTVIEEVWVTLPLSMHKHIVQLRTILKNTATKLHLVPNFQELELLSYDVSVRLDFPVMDVSGVGMNGADLFFKRAIDIIISSLMLIALLPAFIALSILIKLDSNGPIIFVQKRYGIDGREFNLLKFRTMYVQASGANIVQASKNDSRVTSIGRRLRRYSIDEFPQLINVIIGDMSLVGPRPHAKEHNEYYRDKIDGYMSRHMIKPGITGWAQVNGFRGETPMLDDMKQRLHYDLEYIRNWSIISDLTILIKTAILVLKDKKAY